MKRIANRVIFRNNRNRVIARINILAIVLTLFVGIAFGFANGVLIAKLKLPPFIATLGTQMMVSIDFS